jgi:hypothetical protein
MMENPVITDFLKQVKNDFEESVEQLEEMLQDTSESAFLDEIPSAVMEFVCTILVCVGKHGHRLVMDDCCHIHRTGSEKGYFEGLYSCLCMTREISFREGKRMGQMACPSLYVTRGVNGEYRRMELLGGEKYQGWEDGELVRSFLSRSRLLYDSVRLRAEEMDAEASYYSYKICFQNTDEEILKIMPALARVVKGAAVVRAKS